ncbi:MAG: barstar family protein [Alphaproteobacteria bacterium]
MEIKIINIKTDEIKDWDSFHAVFQKAFGFPDFYGRNMNAWIDCMSYLDESDNEMTNITVKSGGIIILNIENSAEFKKRCAEQYEALIECSAFVNYRRIEAGETPVLSLIFSGHY